jgi:hypothetical protein
MHITIEGCCGGTLYLGSANMHPDRRHLTSVIVAGG